MTNDEIRITEWRSAKLPVSHGKARRQMTGLRHSSLGILCSLGFGHCCFVIVGFVIVAWSLVIPSSLPGGCRLLRHFHAVVRPVRPITTW